MRAFAERGMNIGCGYRTGREQAEELARENGANVIPMYYDLCDADSAVGALKVVADSWGRLDSLVVNASIWKGGKLGQMPPDDWWSVVEANVGGMSQIARAALPLLRLGDSPSIVLVSSVVGIIGFPGDTAYATSKSAMFGFARSLAKEVGRDGIRVNVIAPGFVDTAMTAEIPAESKRVIQSQAILGRSGTAEEIADAIVFMSEVATFCTGTILTVDGGWSI